LHDRPWRRSARRNRSLNFSGLNTIDGHGESICIPPEKVAMNLKILRLALHSDAPMRGDSGQLRGFFATSFNEYALLHQHVTGQKGHMVKDFTTAGIKYQYRLGDYYDEDLTLQSSAAKRG